MAGLSPNSLAGWLTDRVSHRVARVRTPRCETWHEAVGLVDALEPTLIGVDVFDTVVVRRVVGDRTVEHAVAHRLVEEGWFRGSKDRYLALRRSGAERNPNGSVRDWYTDESFRAELVDVEPAIAAELAVEREMCVVAPGAVRALAHLRKVAPIVFVSDMHHGRDDLSGLLGDLGLLQEHDRLVVSCDYGTSKSEGGLFEVAFGDALDRPAARAIHIGNNPWADVTRASQAGLQPVFFTGANPSRFEQAMAGRAGTLGPAVAGAARLARLEAEAAGRSVEALGAETIGSMLLAFVLWVESSARTEGMQRLCFLARDGELPLRIAEAMPEDHWDGIALAYLHAGRKSWSLGAARSVGAAEWIELGTQDHAAFLLHSVTRTPAAVVLERCGLTVDDVDQFDELMPLDPTQPMSDLQASAWRSVLRSGRLNDLIAERAVDAHDLITEFLSRRLDGYEKVGLVDVGWRGQQAWLISSLISDAVDARTVHFHFGGLRVSPALDRRVTIQRFALDDSRDQLPIDAPVSAMEMFLASGAPRLVGYERDGFGRVVEQFEAESSEVDTPTRRALAAGALQAAASFPSRAQLRTWGLLEPALIAETREVLRAFWNSPRPDEVQIFAGLRFESDDSGEVISPVLHSYSAAEILDRADVPRQWRQASLVATPAPFRYLMRAYFFAKDSRRRVTKLK